MREIDILGIKYIVKEVECVSKNELNKGEIHYLTNEILIDKTMTDQNKSIVLIHEIIHAITDLMGMPNLCCDEEKVQGLATAFYYVITHNNILQFEKQVENVRCDKSDYGNQ